MAARAIIAAILAGLLGAGTGIILSCRMSRSDLISKPDVPMSCKIVLECLYYTQAGDKSGCFNHLGESCKYNTAYKFCSENVKAIADDRLYRSDFELCLAKQGK